MKQDSVRITVDIPAPLYRKLRTRAAAKGQSARELILAGVKTVLIEGQRPRPRRVRFPLIISKGPRVDVTNERIYEYVNVPDANVWLALLLGPAYPLRKRQIVV